MNDFVSENSTGIFNPHASTYQGDSNSSLPFVGAMIAIICLLVVIAIIAALFVYKRKRKAPPVDAPTVAFDNQAYGHLDDPQVIIRGAVGPLPPVPIYDDLNKYPLDDDKKKIPLNEDDMICAGPLPDKLPLPDDYGVYSEPLPGKDDKSGVYGDPLPTSKQPTPVYQNEPHYLEPVYTLAYPNTREADLYQKEPYYKQPKQCVPLNQEPLHNADCPASLVNDHTAKPEDENIYQEIDC